MRKRKKKRKTGGKNKSGKLQSMANKRMSSLSVVTLAMSFIMLTKEGEGKGRGRMPDKRGRK